MLEITRWFLLLCAVHALCGAPRLAWAKPQPSSARRSASGKVSKKKRGKRTRVQRRVHHRRGGRSRHGLVLSFIADAPFHRELASFGLEAEYQYRFTSAVALTTGADLRLNEDYIFLQPQIGLDVEAGRFSNLGLHAGGGLALPMRLAHDHAAVALAARGFGGLRWHWSMASRIQPQLQVAFLLGPMLTPHHTGYGVYAALQLTVGMRFSL